MLQISGQMGEKVWLKSINMRLPGFEPGLLAFFSPEGLFFCKEKRLLEG